MREGDDADRPVVVCLEAIAPAAMARLAEHAEVLVADAEAPGSADALARADALVVRSRPVGARLLDRCPRVRVIGRHGVGLDAIDLPEAARRGIRVVATPQANATSVAEFTVTAILVLVKQVLPASAALRDGLLAEPGRSLPSLVQSRGLLGRDLASLTVGVVGYGAIGRRVVALLEAFGARCVVHDPFLPPDGERPATLASSLEDLLGRSDVVTLHVPGVPGDAPLLGRAELALMRPGAALVNTARGSLVDADALADSLEQGALGGAAVDVYATEPPDPSGRLLHAPRVLATPHMAAMTHESLARMGEEVVDRVLDALGQVAPQ